MRLSTRLCRSLRITLGYLIALTLGATLLAPVHVSAGTTPQKAAALPPPVQAPASSARQQAPVAIPLAEVATQATVVWSYLDTLNQQTADSTYVQALRDQFDAFSSQNDLDSRNTLRTLREQPTLDKLQSLEQLWQARQQKLNLWLTTLTQRATTLQGELNHLDALQKSWSLTGVSAAAAKAPPQTIQQITAILSRILTEQAPLVAARAAVLDFQDLVAKELTRCGSELASITAAQQKAEGGIFVQNAPPIWSAELRDQARTELVPRLRLFASFYVLPFHQFFVDRPWGLFRLCGLFLLLALLLSEMRRRVLLWESTGDRASAIAVFERPFSGSWWAWESWG